MSAIIIRLADHRKSSPAIVRPVWNPNWFAAEYAEAYSRLFGSLATIWEDCARELRVADAFDGLPSDCEPPDGAA